MADQSSPPAPAGMRVAVVGFGAMGLPMAQRLSSRFDVVGYDPDPVRVQKAVATGLAAVGSVSQAAQGAEVVLLAVRTLGQAETALFGPDGAGAGLGSDAVVALTSTVGAPGARALGQRLGAGGQMLVDMPVSGGPARASQGDLLVFAGASSAALATIRPVLDCMASKVAVVGPNPGDGQAMKTVNQLLCGVHIAAAAEALALAQAMGLGASPALEALGAGAAASFMLSNRGPRVVEALQGGQPEVLSRVDIFVKDMGIVADAGRQAGVALPVAAAAQLYLLAQAAGLGACDDSTVATLLAGPQIGQIAK